MNITQHRTRGTHGSPVLEGDSGTSELQEVLKLRRSSFSVKRYKRGAKPTCERIDKYAINRKPFAFGSHGVTRECPAQPRTFLEPIKIGGKRSLRKKRGQ